ncbi:hypothetical protein LJ756_14770 [Arthrobacter sp. zg-Y411]|uniref:hypothetical protein n=1 Tax=Arthrobacter zhangbolii TaxID=2886936 RepID=UPI001D14CAE8|nr:hypothetical protein [Arthrobacter zhangbolii]MCC3295881.1 hypothetical protein [Arthrobacter zhangbolii]
MNKNGFVFASIFTVAMGLLAGCGTQGDEIHSSKTSTPTATATVPAPNTQACTEFHEAHNELYGLLTSGKGDLTVTGWKSAKVAAVASMDLASLRGEGAVSERMSTAVAILPPDPTQMQLSSGWRIGEEFNTAITRVATACEAEDQKLIFRSIPLAPDMLRNK